MTNLVDSFHSDHFEIQPLANGVFAVIAKNGGAAVSNAGIIDLGQRTLIYDTFLTQQAASDLRKAALHLTGRDPDLIINSHYHNDHTWGNQVFPPNATIISSQNTFQLLQTEGVEEVRWAKESVNQKLSELRQSLNMVSSELERMDLLMWLGYWQALEKSLPDLNVRFPDIIFENHLTLLGSARKVELISFLGAHSGDDVVLYLPEEKIIFLADLLFVNCHPYLAEGNPVTLLEVIDEISDLEAEYLIPGHGPLGTPLDLAKNRDYVSHCLQIARQLASENKSEEAIRLMPVPSQYASWQLSNFYSSNLKALVKNLSNP
jgi:cyclase